MNRGLPAHPSRAMARDWAPPPPPLRSKARKRWLRRMVRLVLVTGAIVLTSALLDTCWSLLHSDRAFSVQHIEVVGLRHHQAAPLLDALRDLRGQNLLELKPSDVSERLSAFPWLKGFLCRKHLPDTLIVEAQESDVLCAVNAKQGVFEINGEGASWPAVRGVAGVFTLSNLDPGDLQVQDLIAQMLRLGLAGQVTAIASAGAGGGYLLTTSDHWKLIVTGGDFPDQWQRFLASKNWVAAYEPDRRTLDVRWADKVVLGPPETPDVSPPATAGDDKGGTQHG